MSAARASGIQPESIIDSHDGPHDSIVDQCDKQTHSDKPQSTNQNISLTSAGPDEKTFIPAGAEKASQVIGEGEEKGSVNGNGLEVLLVEDEKVYLSGPPFIILTLVLMAAILMTALDQNILCIPCTLTFYTMRSLTQYQSLLLPRLLPSSKSWTISPGIMLLTGLDKWLHSLR